jgi:hypothetical protein
MSAPSAQKPNTGGANAGTGINDDKISHMSFSAMSMSNAGGFMQWKLEKNKMQ